MLASYPEEWRDGLPLRNHYTTTVAPIGTTSMIANTLPGYESQHDVVYFHHVGGDIAGTLVEFTDYFLRTLEANELDPEQVKQEARDLLQAEEYEGIHDLSIPDEIAEVFITAKDIEPEAHVRMQAALQKHVDSAISKTINLPKKATHQHVERAYWLAIETGCKGITVYRTGSREEQVLASSEGGAADNQGDTRGSREYGKR